MTKYPLPSVPLLELHYHVWRNEKSKRWCGLASCGIPRLRHRAKSARKKMAAGGGDEHYVNNAQPAGLDEAGVTKVMAAALMQ